MKKTRQEKILELIRQYDIGTQDELIARLRECGYGATQATVSRDIRALKLLKIPTENNAYRYVLPAKEGTTPDSDKEMIGYRKACAESITDIAWSMNNVVIKTTPGMASAVALFLDRLEHNLMLGCVAGDDTIIVVTRTVEDARALSEAVQLQCE